MRISERIVESKILIIRGKKVLIDKDIAELYGVPTKRLNEQVKRNLNRFPDDFMFKLTEDEKSEVVANCDHLRNLKFSSNLPYVFTEYGVVMLASVLNSNRAIEVNIQIVRVFTRLREMVLAHKDILLKMEQLEKQTSKNSNDIQVIFKALRQLLEHPKVPRKLIGFKREDEV